MGSEGRIQKRTHWAADPQSRAGVLPCRLAVQRVEGLLTGLPLALKYPYLEGSPEKILTILCQTRWEVAGISVLVLGESLFSRHDHAPGSTT